MQRFADGITPVSPRTANHQDPGAVQAAARCRRWGINLATAPQCRAAFAHGVEGLLLANQLIGAANMAIIAELIEAGAPVPLRRYREGDRREGSRSDEVLSVSGWEVLKLLDQHAFVRLPER